MKKRLIFILLLVIAATSATASKKIFDDWVEEAVTYDVDGTSLFISATRDHDVIYVKFGSETAGGILNQSNDTLGIYTIFNEGAEGAGYYSNEREKRGYFDTAKDKEIWVYHVVIETNGADIKVTKEINKEILYPKEEGIITIRFENQGSLPAKELKYIERFKDFKLSEHSGCTVNNDSIVVTTDISSGQEHICRFYISETKEREYKSKGDGTYHNGLSPVSFSSKELTVKVHDPELKGRINTSLETIKVGDIADINVTVYNTHETEQININNILLSFSEGIEAVKLNLRPNKIKEWIATEDSRYRVEGWIAPEENKSFRIRVRFLKSGPQTITYSGTFEVVGLVKNLELTKVIDVKVDELDIYDNEEHKLNPGVSDELPIYLGNRGGGGYSFRDITLVINSPDLNISIVKKIDSVGPKEFIPLFPDDIKVPSESGSKNVTVAIDMTYYSESREKFILKKVLNYTIAPLITTIPEDTNISTNLTNESKRGKDRKTFMDIELSKGQKALIVILPMIVIVAGLLLYHKHKKAYKNKYDNLEFEIEYEEDDKEN